MSEWLRIVYSSGSVQVAGIHLHVCLSVCAPVFCLEARPPDFLCASWCPDLEWALQWAWPQTQCVTEQNWEVPISYRNLYSNSITFSIWDDPEMIRLTFTRVFSMKNRFAEQIYRNNMFSLAAVIDLREASRVDSPSKYSFNVTLKCLCLLYTETWPYDFEKSYPTLSHRVSLLGVTVSSISECLGEVELSHLPRRETLALLSLAIRLLKWGPQNSEPQRILPGRREDWQALGQDIEGRTVRFCLRRRLRHTVSRGYPVTVAPTCSWPWLLPSYTAVTLLLGEKEQGRLWVPGFAKLKEISFPLQISVS